tara:strand:- start:1853 stop:2758 length:906 start_codon:yes stop_codon:yes gene_type:complete
MHNQIITHQDEPQFLKLLRARSETYREASHWQITQFFLTVVAPLLGAVVAILTPDARPYVAAAALVIAMLDSSMIDRIQKQKLRTAARIAEQFDCELLEMPWNPHAAGKKVEPEIIEGAAQRWPNGEEKLLGWYPTAVGQVSIHLARIICQRTNLWYDGTLREKYSLILLWSAIAIAILLFFGGFVARLSLVDFVAVVMAPATPVVNWTLREIFRQRDAVDALKLARAEAEALWETALNGGCGPTECARLSREFQNTIFARRANNPLIFPKIYDWLRPTLETQMNRGAEAYVQELKGGVEG